MPILSASAIAGYAKNAGLSGQAVSIATAIALAESGGNTEATHKNSNGSIDFGLWQINSVHTDLLSGADWRDPAQNAKMMMSISNNGNNFKPWTTYTSGKYLAYLGQANAVSPDTSVGGYQNASLSSDLKAIQNFAIIISDPQTWIRMGMVIGGGILVLVAVHKTVDTHIAPVAKIATKVT